MKRKLLTLLLVPLLLTSCNDSKPSFYVPTNLDLYTSTATENLTPIELNCLQFRTLIEAKTSFVLYYYSDKCEHCEKVKPLVSQYLLKNDILMYQIHSFEVYKNNSVLGNWKFIFEEAVGTPQIMFFNEGVFTSMMPHNKFSSGYNTFEGTLNHTLSKSNILYGHTLKGLNYFFDNYKQYMVYFSKSYDGTEENHFENYGLHTFNSKFYDLVKAQKTFATLYVNLDALENDAYALLDEKYQISKFETPYFVGIHRQTLNQSYDEVLSYSSENGINDIVNKINEYFITL